MESIGRKIKEVLKKRGITVYRVAKDLGIAEESLRRSLADGANPEWKRIQQVLRYLDYEVVLRPRRKEVKPKK